MLSDTQLRWLAVSVVMLSSALNYLDRMVLSALVPTLKNEFQITSQQFGYVISAFSITYAICAPLMGLLIDRIGVKIGAALVVGAWSLAGISTGLVNSFTGLLMCRAMLGVAEAGGIPATGKVSGLYLAPRDRAIGSALSQVGLTLGIMSAPVFTTWLSRLYGWRSAFIASGLLGFMWIPLWLFVANKAKANPEARGLVEAPVRQMLRDRRFVGLVGANILAMTVYSLWTVWTTHFLVTQFRLSQDEANLRYAWIPSIFATLGGLLGGWLALRLIRGGVEVLQARFRVALLGAVLVLMTAAAPFAPTPALATAAICAGLFWTTCLSVNYYAIPIDIFSPERAAFGVAVLTGAFGLMQAFLSPAIGRWCDTFGWQPVCLLVGILPLASIGVLKIALRTSS